MYQCSLQIAVFSHHQVAGEVIREIPPLKHFSHRIMERTDTSPLLLQGSQVVVQNLGPALLPSELHLRCQKEAVLIYCGEHEQIGAFDLSGLRTVDEFREMPYRQEHVRLRMGNIFRRVKTEYDLCITRTYLDIVIDSLPDMMQFKSLDGIRVRVNKVFCTVVGKSGEDMTRRNHCYVQGVSSDNTENGEASYRELEQTIIRADHTLQFAEEVKYSRGIRQLRTYRTPTIDRDGVTVLGAMGVGHDITDLGNMSAGIEIPLQSMPYAILLRDKEGRILSVNEKFEEYLRTERKNVVGRNYEGWITRTFAEPHTINNEEYVEAMASLPEGFERILEIRENFIHDIFHDVVGKLCIFRDVTVERSLEEQILHSSNTNFLTGLYSRRCLYKYISDNREDRTVNLLCIGLDSFKATSDSYRHRVGDAVLIHTTQILSGSFRKDFVARFDGDEFLVIRLGDCPVCQLEQEADHFLEEIRNEFQAAEQVLMLFASVGIAQASDTGIGIDLLLQRSGQALYRTKRGGRNRYCMQQERAGDRFRKGRNPYPHK